MVTWASEIEAPDGTLHLIGCGSRTWIRCDVVSTVLERVRHQYPLLTVIEGGAPYGADKCVEYWAAAMRQRGVHWIHHPARWSAYSPGERWRAGHDRNEEMVDRLRQARDADHGVCVVAFKERLDSRLFGPWPDHAAGGTEDCIRRAWANDIPVWWWSHTNGPPERCMPAATLDL